MTTNVRLVANSQFSALSDAAVDGIITIDAQGIITSFNRSAERLFRYRRAEVIGRNVSVLMPPEHAQNHDHYLQRHLRTGKARVIGTGREVEGRRKDGTRFPLYLSVGEFFIDGAVGFVGICHDLTLYHNAIRELVASEERYQDIVDSQDQFICRINRKRRLSFVNRAFATLLGKPQEDILGRTLQGARPGTGGRSGPGPQGLVCQPVRPLRTDPRHPRSGGTGNPLRPVAVLQTQDHPP